MDEIPNRAWIEDGIAYSEYHGDLTLKAILDMQARLIALAKQSPDAVFPAIVIMNDVRPGSFKLGLQEFSKIITSFNLTSHTSGFWVVGANEDIKRKAAPLNKIFFGGNIHYVETLEEAKAAARKVAGSHVTILDLQGEHDSEDG